MKHSRRDLTTAGDTRPSAEDIQSDAPVTLPGSKSTNPKPWSVQSSAGGTKRKRPTIEDIEQGNLRELRAKWSRKHTTLTDYVIKPVTNKLPTFEVFEAKFGSRYRSENGRTLDETEKDWEVAKDSMAAAGLRGSFLQAAVDHTLMKGDPFVLPLYLFRQNLFDGEASSLTIGTSAGRSIEGSSDGDGTPQPVDTVGDSLPGTRSRPGAEEETTDKVTSATGDVTSATRPKTKWRLLRVRLCVAQEHRK